MSESAAARHGPGQGRLAVRLIAPLVLGVAVIYAATTVWSIRSQRRHMIGMVETAAERCSMLIRNATREGMLENDTESLDRILLTMSESEGIHRVRILDRDGRVRRCSTKDVGASLPLDAFQCQICHTQDPIPSALPGSHRMRVIERDGVPFLNVVEPIPNEPACSTQACHAHESDRRILGIIDIELPLAPMEAHIQASETQLGVGFLLTVLAIVGLTLFLLWRMVIQPVRHLSEAAERVARGDFSATVPTDAPDEIGRMSRSWNVMVGELGRAHAELEEWGHKLERRVEDKTTELEAAHRRMLVVEKMASLGKLAAVMAHEINNPLAGIATYAKLMHRRVVKAQEAGGGFDPDSQKVLALMESEARRCGTIVKNLLLFSRQPGARFSTEDLGPILERCALLVKHQADLQDVEIQVGISPDLSPVECDASQIQQVILALVMNALDAMADGGTLSVQVAPQGWGDDVVLEVIDTGSGIDPEDLPHVFDPFFTTKEQGEGVGLGLSVVYGIVKRHHGQIDVDSTPGEGTRFKVTLPRLQPAPLPDDADDGGEVDGADDGGEVDGAEDGGEVDGAEEDAR